MMEILVVPFTVGRQRRLVAGCSRSIMWQEWCGTAVDSERGKLRADRAIVGRRRRGSTSHPGR